MQQLMRNRGGRGSIDGSILLLGPADVAPGLDAGDGVGASAGRGEPFGGAWKCRLPSELTQSQPVSLGVARNQ